MMKKIIVIVAMTVLFSCVSKKKWDALNRDKSSLEVDKADCNDLLKAEQEKNASLNSENGNIVTKLSELSEKNLITENDLKQLKEQYQILSQVSNSDAKKLKEEMEKAQKLRASLEQNTLELESKSKALQSAETTLEQREKRMKELEGILEEQKKAVEKLRSKVANSLLNFSSDELQVNVKDGKIYVSMAENLLFKSGQYTIDAKGLKALSDLSVVLSKQTDVDIVVEGHTDNVAFTSPNIPKDNWDLSVLRSTTVVRELQKNGVNPKVLVPSGRSQYLPKASGNTVQDKALNRRIEIIISPSLAELYKLLESK